MDEGRKRVLGIIAGILVALHLNTMEDLTDTYSGEPQDLFNAGFRHYLGGANSPKDR